MTTFTAIIKGRSSSDALEECLDALSAEFARTLPDDSLECIVVDPPASEEDRAPLTIQDGVDRSTGDKLIFLDSNARFVEGGLAELIRFLDRSGVGAAQPRCWVTANRTFLWQPLGPGPRPLGETLHFIEADTPLEAASLSGHVVAMRRSLIDRVGLPDGGDLTEEWCRKAKEAGFGIYYLPGAEATVGLCRLDASSPEPGDPLPDLPDLAPDRRHFVEVAADPRYRSSVGAFVDGNEIRFSKETLACFESGKYHLRLVDPESLEVVHEQIVRIEPRPERNPITSSDTEISPYRPGDEESILELWKKVFQKDRRMEKWKWLFPWNPAGMHIMLARKRSDQSVIAQFAGVLTRVLVQGEIHTFAQMVDSMSDPDCRQTLSRAGIFTQTVLSYVDTWGKPGEESFGFGLPNRAAYRIGKRSQGYTDVFPLQWRVRSIDDSFPPEAQPVRRTDVRIATPDRIEPRIDSLWKRVQSRYAVQTVRDFTYLEWRYMKNPDATYRFFQAERGSEIVGLAVVVERFLDEPTFAVVDWMLADGDEEAGKALRMRIEEAARAAGSRKILGSFLPLGSAPDRLFEGAGYPLEKSVWKWVGRIYDPDRLTWDLMRTGFFLTLGDSDLV